MNIAEEASLIRQLEEARAIINQRNGEILHLKREAARYREQRDLLWSNLNGHFDRVFSPRQGT